MAANWCDATSIDASAVAMAGGLASARDGCAAQGPNHTESPVSPHRDFAGSILLRITRSRGHKIYKAFVSVFVCFSYCAVHLEVVSNLRGFPGCILTFRITARTVRGCVQRQRTSSAPTLSSGHYFKPTTRNSTESLAACRMTAFSGASTPVLSRTLADSGRPRSGHEVSPEAHHRLG